MEEGPKFSKRYVLGEGYPWFYGTKDYKQIGLNNEAVCGSAITLICPEEIWSRSVPKFRLVLELIEEKKRRKE